MNICFVTSNDNKLREAQEVLGIELERVNLELLEPQSMNIEEIIEIKIKAAFDELKKPVIVEDAGLFIDAWNGFPGPFIKWMAKSMGNEALTKAIPKTNRKVTWRVAYGYYDGKKIETFIGEVDGTIADKPREGGWGFDPIFIPEGETETYSQMGQRKYDHSARARALRKLHDYLTK